MIALVLGIVKGVMGWLNDVLPNSPFDSLIAGNDAILQGIGWLNWFIPVADMLLIFAGYLAVLIAWVVIDHLLSTAGKTIFGAVAGK